MIKNTSLHGIDADMAALGAGIGDMREFEGKSSWTIIDRMIKNGSLHGIDIETDMDSLRAKVQNIMREFESMKIPLRKIPRFFCKAQGKKEQAVSVGHILFY